MKSYKLPPVWPHFWPLCPNGWKEKNTSTALNYSLTWCVLKRTTVLVETAGWQEGSQMRHSEHSGGRISVTTHQRAVWVAQPPSPGRVGCGFPAPDPAPQSCGGFHLETSPQQHAQWVSTKGRWRSVIARAQRAWVTKSTSFNNYRRKENKQQNLEIHPPALSGLPSQPCPAQTPWLVGARN